MYITTKRLMQLKKIIKFTLIAVFCFSLSTTVESCTSSAKPRRYRASKRKVFHRKRRRNKKIPKKGKIPCPLKDC